MLFCSFSHSLFSVLRSPHAHTLIAIKNVANERKRKTFQENDENFKLNTNFRVQNVGLSHCVALSFISSPSRSIVSRLCVHAPICMRVRSCVRVRRHAFRYAQHKRNKKKIKWIQCNSVSVRVSRRILKHTSTLLTQITQTHTHTHTFIQSWIHSHRTRFLTQKRNACIKRSKSLNIHIHPTVAHIVCVAFVFKSLWIIDTVVFNEYLCVDTYVYRRIETIEKKYARSCHGMCSSFFSSPLENLSGFVSIYSSFRLCSAD